MFKFIKRAKYTAYLDQLNENLNETIQAYQAALQITSGYIIATANIQKHLRMSEMIYDAWPAAEMEIRQKAGNLLDLRMMTIMRNIKDMQQEVLNTYRTALDLQNNDEFIKELNRIGEQEVNDNSAADMKALESKYDFEFRSIPEIRQLISGIIQNINEEMYSIPS